METYCLYLVRHGENWANLTKELSHRKVDYSLTPKGVLQAQQTAYYFKGKGITAIYASPLKRAVETAQVIAKELGLPLHIQEAFREVNVGNLEGQPASAAVWQIHNRIVEDWLAGDLGSRFPGGEDYQNLAARFRRGVWESLAQGPGQAIIIVGHGGMFTFGLKALCPDVDEGYLRSVESHNCSITTLQILKEGDAWIGQLEEWASYAHIHGEAAQFVTGIPTNEHLEDWQGLLNE